MNISLTHDGALLFGEPDWLTARGVPADVIAAALDAALIREAHAAIDALCDAAYTVSVSRGARYQRKLDEARAYVAAGRPAEVEAAAFPILAAEAVARGVGPSALADMILGADAAYWAPAAVAEAERAAVQATIAASPDEAGKRAAAAAGIETVRAAVAGLLP